MNDTFNRMILAMWILLGSGAGTILYFGTNVDQVNAGGGGTGVRIAYAVVYLIIAGLLVHSGKKLLPIIREERWILVLLLWAIASTAWSTMPGTTLRRSIALLGTTIIGLFVATRFDARQQIRIVAYCISLVAIVTLAACQFYPESAISPAGEWLGIFNQKNELGRAMGLGVFCFAFLSIGEPRKKAIPILMMIFCGSILVMSKSMSAILVCATMMTFLPFRKLLLYRARTVAAVVLSLVALGIPIGIYVTENIETILKALGRDITLTGRLPLWHEVLDEIATRPWRGFGYSAFWFSPEGARIQAKLYWPMFHSHNGYLEVTLALGLIGTLLLILVLVYNLIRGFRLANTAESVYDFWPIFFLVFALLDNLTECWFLTANSVLWALAVANSYLLVRYSLQPAFEQEYDSSPNPELALANSVGSVSMEPGGS